MLGFVLFNYRIFPGGCFMCTWGCVFCCCWMACSVISLKFSCSKMWFNANIYLLIFCLANLFIADSRVLKSPSITVLSFSLLKFIIICLIYFNACAFGTYNTYDWLIHLLDVLTPLSLYNYLLCLMLPFWLDVCFVWYKDSCCLLISICLEYHMPSFHLSLYVFSELK